MRANYKIEWIVLILVIIFSFGCNSTKRVVAITGETDVPYSELGHLEVNLKAGPLAFGRERRLKSYLAKKAKQKYNADAVINVEFWPYLESDSFPEGKIYARGTMIKYQSFPKATPK